MLGDRACGSEALSPGSLAAGSRGGSPTLLPVGPAVLNERLVDKKKRVDLSWGLSNRQGLAREEESICF